MIKQKSLNSKERTSKRKKRSDLMKDFGINADQYEAMLSEQNHVCAICNKPDICNRDLALCTNCNMALGKFQDDLQNLRKAIEYMERAYSVPEIADSIERITHDDRPNWKMLVTTPDGLFPSMSHAAKHYKVHETTIRGWCLADSTRKKEGYSCEKLYISMNDLKEHINVKTKSK